MLRTTRRAPVDWGSDKKGNMIMPSQPGLDGVKQWGELENPATGQRTKLLAKDPEIRFEGWRMVSSSIRGWNYHLRLVCICH